MGINLWELCIKDSKVRIRQTIQIVALIAKYPYVIKVLKRQMAFL